MFLISLSDKPAHPLSNLRLQSLQGIEYTARDTFVSDFPQEKGTFLFIFGGPGCVSSPAMISSNCFSQMIASITVREAPIATPCLSMYLSEPQMNQTLATNSSMSDLIVCLDRAGRLSDVSIACQLDGLRHGHMGKKALYIYRKDCLFLKKCKAENRFHFPGRCVNFGPRNIVEKIHLSAIRTHFLEQTKQSQGVSALFSSVRLYKWAGCVPVHLSILKRS